MTLFGIGSTWVLDGSLYCADGRFRAQGWRTFATVSQPTPFTQTYLPTAAYLLPYVRRGALAPVMVLPFSTHRAVLTPPHTPDLPGVGCSQRTGLPLPSPSLPLTLQHTPLQNVNIFSARRAFRAGSPYAALPRAALYYPNCHAFSSVPYTLHPTQHPHVVCVCCMRRFETNMYNRVVKEEQAFGP